MKMNAVPFPAAWESRYIQRTRRLTANCTKKRTLRSIRQNVQAETDTSFITKRSSAVPQNTVPAVPLQKQSRVCRILSSPIRTPFHPCNQIKLRTAISKIICRYTRRQMILYARKNSPFKSVRSLDWTFLRITAIIIAYTVGFRRNLNERKQKDSAKRKSSPCRPKTTSTHAKIFQLL